MADRWIFTKEQLQNTPSRKSGIDQAKELAYRQQAAGLIQDMGQRLQVNQLCINTAIVYMHRFYMFQSFTRFHRTVIAPACLFLAAKVEEQLRKLEHVIKVARSCIHRDQPALDVKSEAYLELAQELVVNENILLQSLGFDIQVDHPHTHVVKTCQLVRASKDLAQTSYFLATNSLHLTTMCLQYKPTVVACVCIHIASNWSEYEIAMSHEGKPWYSYVDKSVTPELLTGLTQEFLNILEKCPLKLQKKIQTWKSGNRDDEMGQLEKRHKTELGSSATRPSSSHDKQANESSRHDKRSEPSKGHRSETVPSHSEMKPRLPEDTSARHNSQPVPNQSRKSLPDASSNRSGQSLSQSTSFTDSTDSHKRLSEQSKPMSFKDYKTYREHKEKQQGGTPSGSTPHESDRKMHGMSSVSDLHRKHKQSSSSSGDEKKSKREYERKHSSHIQQEVSRKELIRPEEPSKLHIKREPEESLKMHIKKEPEESLKVHIKKERSDESLKLHIKKESGTHKIKPTGSPLKLTIKTLPNESSPKTHEKESLKMKLSLKGQTSSGERPAKQRRSESYSSHSGTNLEPGKHGHSSSRGGSGIDGNGVPNSGQRLPNSHHKSVDYQSRSGHEGNSGQLSGPQLGLSFNPERGASGSIFSPPPGPQNFDANMFNTGAMLSLPVGGLGSTSVGTPGYGGYHQQSSTFNDSFSSFLQGIDSNGASMKPPPVTSMPTKEDIQQMESSMQQMIGRHKQLAQQQLLQQQQQQARYGYMGMPGYHQSNPPLPNAPPPPPPPPDEPVPPPPPPPPSN